MKFLCNLILFFIFICITLAEINYARVLQKNKSSVNFTIIKFLQESIDQDVDPCEDFYQFTCGKWLSKNKLNGKSLYSNENNLNDLINDEIINLIQNIVQHKSKAINMLKIVFDKCISKFSTTIDLRSSTSYCLKFVNYQMNYVVDALYVNEKISKNDIKKVNKILKNLIKIFISTFKNQTWMKKDEKNEIVVKLKKMKYFVASNDLITNYTILDKYFENLSIQKEDSFDQIEYKLNSFVISNEFEEKYGEINYVDSTVQANAAYFDRDNKIFIGAGYINLPFYHINLPISMTYGAFGSLVGHEIMHGFDIDGINFNKNGKIKKMFSNESEKKFYKKSKCFVQQYNNYMTKQSKLYINGTSTLSENIADNEGLKIAFKAYTKYAGNTNNFNIQIYKNYTNEQLFFIAYGKSFCTKRSLKNEIQLIKYGEYSNERYRVIGAVSNNNDFSKAFNCKPGLPMNPINKCTLWN